MRGSRNLFARPRVVSLPEMLGVPDLVVFGRYNYTAAHFFIPPHRHAAEIMEISFLVKGRQTYRVGCRVYTLRGGDALIVFPHEQHSTDGAPQEKGTLYWIQLRVAGPDAPFLGLPKEQAGPLVRELLRLKPRHFPAGCELKQLLDEILVTSQQPGCPLRATRMANRMVAVLLHLIDRSRSATKRAAPHRLDAVLRHIEQHLDARLTLPQLATQAGLSVSRFKTLFKQETGMPPVEYILRAKIEEAKRRLARGTTTVTATAFALGFSTSQYFATVFKRYAGYSPRLHPRAAGNAVPPARELTGRRASGMK